ncbi:MAG: NAD(+) diphosphatase [Micromonosporaceae bacterium]
MPGGSPDRRQDDPSGRRPLGDDPAWVGRTVDRAAHRRGDAEWLSKAWQRGRVVVVDGNHALVVGDPPSLVMVDAGAAPDGDRLFLGVDADDVPYFAVAGEPPELDGASSATLRLVGALLSARDADLFATAAGLVNWHTRYRFCPTTGQPTESADGGWVRRTADGEATVFPRTDPAVIVLVSDGQPGETGRAMLGRGATWPEGRFSCLAGFVEPGESAETTVAREVAEEVGLAVGDIRYVTSQPWPFPGSLMLAFTALADPAEPLRLDPAEIAEAHWFTRSELRELWRSREPITTSVAYHLMAGWLNG